MPNKTFMALLASGAGAVFSGFFSIFLLYLLLGHNNCFDGYRLTMLLIVMGIFINSAICFVLCLVVYFPICVLDNEKIKSSSFKELLTRYIPIITIPLVVVCILFYYLVQDDIPKNIILLIIINVFFVCYISLWIFTKIIQLANYEIDQK
jgi:hypothetical protein